MAPGSRLDNLRRAKWAAGLVALVLVSGGLGHLVGRSRGRREAEPPQAEPSWTASPPTAPNDGSRSREAGAPSPAVSAAPVPTDPLIVRVIGEKGPEAGVFVRVIDDDRARDSHRTCSSLARTDEHGLATVAVERAAPESAWLELARGDASGLRHGFVALGALRAGIAAREPVMVPLPEGGSLAMRFEGLPAEARPRTVTFWVFPPFGEWRALFADEKVLPAGDGGLVECRAVPESYRVKVGEDGVARLAHVPADHAVAVREMDLPPATDAWIATESASTGPVAPAPDGDVLRVPEGAKVEYVQRWKARPSARVRVVAADGKPVAGARVGYGFRQGGTPPRFFDVPARTGADGVATIVLWSGPALPSWIPEGIVFAASAGGHRAAVVEAKGAWYGLDVEARLGPAAPGRFVVEGTLAYPNARPAAGVPLRLASPEPYNAHGAIEPLRGKADADGHFAIEVPEDVRPLFEFTGGVRVIVDDEALEDMPVDALWRGRWPSLPRATLVPSTVALPEPGGRAHTTARLSLPP